MNDEVGTQRSVGPPAEPAELREASIALSLAELVEVRRTMLEAEAAALAGRCIHPDHALGARNLAHYLALRARELRPLQERLSRLGLSSLGRCEAHALASVEAVLEILERLTGTKLGGSSPSQCASFDDGRRDLEARTTALLGPSRPGRGVRIMLTLSPEATEDLGQLRSWLDHGVDCVRINCAHDGPAEWERMLQSLRRVEQASGHRPRVLMDLAGPKLRTGPIAPGPRVLRIRPERDELGRARRPLHVWLSRGMQLPPGLADAQPLPVDSAFWQGLEVGDVLELVDARESKRRLRIVQVHPDGAWAELERTAYVLAGTELRCRGSVIGRVGSLEPREGSILLARGDRLVLTRSLAAGHDAQRDEHGRLLSVASIGCTLGEIFSRVGAGERIWFDDGRIGGTIRHVAGDHLVVEITAAREGGEKLRADKGINLPDSALDLPALTAKDQEDLEFVVRHAQAVGYSFVHRPEDVDALAERLARLGRPELGIVLKIETRRAFERLPELLFAAMRSAQVGIMIARGDLAVECGWERMAEAQEEILWLSEAAHVPVIWATQVLESLAKGGQPSRAEITDAAMGERAECVMLNKGPHMGQAVAALDDILRRMQAHQHKKTSMLRPLRLAAGYGSLRIGPRSGS